MAENNLASLNLKKTISRSTEFLTDIWYTLSRNPSVDKKRTGRYFNNIQCTNTNDSIDLRTEELKPSLEICDDLNSTAAQSGPNSNITMDDARWTPENLLSDALVDKMLLYKVQKQKRRSYFYMQSRVLYNYLSFQIGSESIMKLRRTILEKGYLGGVYGCPMLISGSKAEGLDMPGSDIDAMICVGEALEGRLSLENFLNYTYDSLEYDERPGYVTVKCSLKNRTEQACLPSSTWKGLMMRLIPFCRLILELGIHGPSFSGSFCGSDMDLVPCLKSPTWPKIAEEWIIRERKYGWPTDDSVMKIVSNGCHMVPISSKSDQLHGIEWRLSFSVAEKQLIKSFNHVQILIYAFLKLVLKEIIEKEERLKNLLCSYFLKTTLFWVIEETKQEVWCPKYTFLCFHLCLERLLKCVTEENCPNYFVQINNMFLGRFTESAKELLLHVLCNLCDQGFELVSRISTMSNILMYIKDPYSVFELKVLQREKEKKETVHLLLGFLEMFKSLICFSSKHPKVFEQRLKSLLKIPFLRKSGIHTFCHLINTNDRRMSNKEKYICEKLVLRMILYGSEMDRSSRDSMLASWLYGIGKFHDCLQVIDYVLTTISTIDNYLDSVDSTMMLRLSDDIKDIHTILTYRTTDVAIPLVSHIVPIELMHVVAKLFIDVPVTRKYSTYNPEALGFTPEQYYYFMICLCQLKLADRDRFDHSWNEFTNITFEGPELEKAVRMRMQMLLKTAVKVTKKSRKEEIFILFCEELLSFTDSGFDIDSMMKSFIGKGLNHEIESEVLNALQMLNVLKDMANNI